MYWFYKCIKSFFNLFWGIDNRANSHQNSKTEILWKLNGIWFSVYFIVNHLKKGIVTFILLLLILWNDYYSINRTMEQQTKPFCDKVLRTICSNWKVCFGKCNFKCCTYCNFIPQQHMHIVNNSEFYLCRSDLSIPKLALWRIYH